MLTLEEFIQLLEDKEARGEPLVEGSCFGVSDPAELRPTFNNFEEEFLKGAKPATKFTKATERIKEDYLNPFVCRRHEPEPPIMW